MHRETSDGNPQLNLYLSTLYTGYTKSVWNMENRGQMPLGNLLPRVNREQNKNLKPKKKKKNKKHKMTGEEIRSHVTISGRRFIGVFTKLLQKTDVQRAIRGDYLRRVLHSTFFYGHICKPSISPEDFIPEDKLSYFRNTFLQAFQEYSTHVPRQDPYAILLEFILTYKPFDDPRDLRNCLLAINVSLQFVDVDSYMPVANCFTASVIAISTYSDANGKVQMTACGSSIAFKGDYQRQIMIAISVLHVRDRVISYAVCQEGESPAVLFPNQVQCKAYTFLPKEKNFKEVAPCIKCERTFRNVDFHPLRCKENKNASWPFGNCAEYASISNLLLARQDLRSGIVTEEDQDGNQLNVREIEDVFIRKYEGRLTEELRDLLERTNFTLAEELFLFQ